MSCRYFPRFAIYLLTFFYCFKCVLNINTVPWTCYNRAKHLALGVSCFSETIIFLYQTVVQSYVCFIPELKKKKKKNEKGKFEQSCSPAQAPGLPLALGDLGGVPL